MYICFTTTLHWGGADSLTHCHLVTQYVNMDLSQHWLRWYILAWRHQAFARINIDRLSEIFCSIHLKVGPRKIPLYSNFIIRLIFIALSAVIGSMWRISYIYLGCFNDAGTSTWLTQGQWSNLRVYGYIDMHPNTTKGNNVHIHTHTHTHIYIYWYIYIYILYIYILIWRL